VPFKINVIFALEGQHIDFIVVFICTALRGRGQASKYRSDAKMLLLTIVILNGNLR
jgi:hypothetical protein